MRVLLPLLLLGALAGAANPKSPQLPAKWAGWQVVKQAPAGISGAPAAVLQEYGLRGQKSAMLARQGRKVLAEVWQFGDATGGFGAYTFFRPAHAQLTSLGPLSQLAIASPVQAWGWRDHWVVEFRAGAQSGLPNAKNLGELLAALPRIQAGSHNAPLLPQYLPKQGLAPESVIYSEGPASLAAAAPWLPSSQVGFEEDAEVVVGSYQLRDAAGQLAIINYPTPQIAQDRLGLLSKAGVDARRTGALLAIWHGPKSAAAAKLLGRPEEHSVVTWTRFYGLDSLPGLILGIFALIGIIIAVSLGAGFLAGALRVLLARVYPRRFSVEAATARFTRLNLR